MVEANTAARILDISGHPVQRIQLRVGPEFHFLAGQYVNVLHPAGTAIPLSIASAPSDLPDLELHYRSTPGMAEAQAMDELLTGKTLTLTPAGGDVILADDPKPLLIISGGTGAAQAFSCAQHRASQRTEAATIDGSAGRPSHSFSTTLLWCADNESDIYATDRLAKWVDTLVIRVDDKRTPANEGMVWMARHGANFKDHNVLLAGSPGFVYAASDTLEAAGLDVANFHADAFSYAPRV